MKNLNQKQEKRDELLRRNGIKLSINEVNGNYIFKGGNDLAMAYFKDGIKIEPTGGRKYSKNFIYQHFCEVCKDSELEPISYDDFFNTVGSILEYMGITEKNSYGLAYYDKILTAAGSDPEFYNSTLPPHVMLKMLNKKNYFTLNELIRSDVYYGQRTRSKDGSFYGVTFEMLKNHENYDTFMRYYNGSKEDLIRNKIIS
ncbi:MAG: hypothetical protein A2015_07045 [Spirochaetes bacterium GWF1_31_7]|nr:MAG: hypothetical protein A2Y29_00600 [Spirochaetes bacterium GWE2_31_10]OHD48569.1 MAG: hypothetical protein A2015_07045 [Spirochaetes bacterium GWF1_31_7]OHD81634.1 MAG: hypothetical protein A2355_14485 [Spirochaetes bacterium RIFOXYB1_FULL_32_8]HBD94718.1 hypothetical protein [Spirochaetia bacterium]HBI39046.1 hypothetical protein [Spirochaetia bacterium]